MFLRYFYDSELFSVQFGKHVNQVHSPMTMIVTQILSWQIESNTVFENHTEHVELLLVLACLMRECSEIRL